MKLSIDQPTPKLTNHNQVVIDIKDYPSFEVNRIETFHTDQSAEFTSPISKDFNFSPATRITKKKRRSIRHRCAYPSPLRPRTATPQIIPSGIGIVDTGDKITEPTMKGNLKKSHSLPNLDVDLMEEQIDLMANQKQENKQKQPNNTLLRINSHREVEKTLTLSEKPPPLPVCPCPLEITTTQISSKKSFKQELLEEVTKRLLRQREQYPVPSDSRGKSISPSPQIVTKLPLTNQVQKSPPQTPEQLMKTLKPLPPCLRPLLYPQPLPLLPLLPMTITEKNGFSTKWQPPLQSPSPEIEPSSVKKDLVTNIPNREEDTELEGWDIDSLETEYGQKENVLDIEWISNDSEDDELLTEYQKMIMTSNHKNITQKELTNNNETSLWETSYQLLSTDDEYDETTETSFMSEDSKNELTESKLVINEYKTPESIDQLNMVIDDWEAQKLLGDKDSKKDLLSSWNSDFESCSSEELEVQDYISPEEVLSIPETQTSTIHRLLPTEPSRDSLSVTRISLAQQIRGVKPNYLKELKDNFDEMCTVEKPPTQMIHTLEVLKHQILNKWSDDERVTLMGLVTGSLVRKINEVYCHRYTQGMVVGRRYQWNFPKGRLLAVLDHLIMKYRGLAKDRQLIDFSETIGAEMADVVEDFSLIKEEIQDYNRLAELLKSISTQLTETKMLGLKMGLTTDQMVDTLEGLDEQLKTLRFQVENRRKPFAHKCQLQQAKFNYYAKIANKIKELTAWEEFEKFK